MFEAVESRVMCFIMRLFFLQRKVVAVALRATRALPTGKRLQCHFPGLLDSRLAFYLFGAFGALPLQPQLTASCGDVIAFLAA
jgi:hypothetical protein